MERLGIAQSRERIASADAVLLILDGSLGQNAATSLGQEGDALAHNARTIVVWNKCDVAPNVALPSHWQDITCVNISAKEGLGLTALSTAIKDKLLHASLAEPRAGDVVPNMRQAALLQEATEELTLLEADIKSAMPYDICAVRLDAAVHLLGQITGLDTPDELLDKIFATFCIGK